MKRNGCRSKPVVERLPDQADDGTTVIRKTYSARTGGADVVLIEIQGGGHSWPGQPALEGFLGKATEDISANDLMWQFFQEHRLP